METQTEQLPTLAAVRRRAVLSQRELAQASGVCLATISHIECGKQTPRQSTMRLLSAALGVPPHSITWPGNPLHGPSRTGA